ncbi:MAG: hypothetical protein HYR73_07770 [Candidatus Eisenbacteria bacterium]|nr:hypothetical protein [Candidatus Eisenbacteria bacterium]
MKRLLSIAGLVAAACMAFAVLPALAHDVDGPNDCQKPYRDFGDAPECIPAYPSGVLGKFPTCILTPATCPIGTQEFACPPISTAPGATGYVVHTADFNSYWLGCYITPLGPEGVDGETDGKTNTPAIGLSACSDIATDCVEVAFGGMTFDQDECYADGSDAGITAPIVFGLCSVSSVSYSVTNCAPVQRYAYLNICVDWNEDADWNDNFQCNAASGGACAYEWAVKNAPIFMPPGCALLTSPAFLSGPFKVHSWLRITISDNPAADDYPWNGSVSIGPFQNGETEDYPVEVTDRPTPAHGSTWGQLKVRYR